MSNRETIACFTEELLKAGRHVERRHENIHHCEVCSIFGWTHRPREETHAGLSWVVEFAEVETSKKLLYGGIVGDDSRIGEKEKPQALRGSKLGGHGIQPSLNVARIQELFSSLPKLDQFMCEIVN